MNIEFSHCNRGYSGQNTVTYSKYAFCVNHQKSVKESTRGLTAIEGAISQIVQPLLAATAGTASAPPLIIVVTTGPRLHLLLQDHPANSLWGGNQGEGKMSWRGDIGWVKRNQERRRANEHIDGTLQVSRVGWMQVLIDSDGIMQ